MKNREATSGSFDGQDRARNHGNHLFQKGKGKAVPSEYLKPAEVDPRVIDDIAKWVKSIWG